MKPFLKWAGGKTRLLPELLKYVPETYNRYIEPFVGGGALLLELQPERAIVSDLNKDLIDAYSSVLLYPDRLCELLDIHKSNDSQDYYKKIVGIRNRNKMVTVNERAAMLIYLNKTCFNGLFRVNRNGGFNVPYGKYDNQEIYDAENIKNVHAYLYSHVSVLPALFFYTTLNLAEAGDFIYCDPPYHGGFTAYTAQGFTEEDQMELAGMCADLSNRGCHVLASNSNTDFIKQLWEQYRCFDIYEVEAPRSINCKGNGRGKIKELIITNVRREV